MVDTAFERHVLLESLTAAFARGDSPDGERLLGQALDLGIPWDEVTGAAARGVVDRFGTPEAVHGRA